MNRAITIFVLLLAVAAATDAQYRVKGDTLIEDVRPVGELRLWTFITKDSTLGQLISTVTGETEVDDVAGLVLEQRFTLDLAGAGMKLSIRRQGKHLVSDVGAYLGDSQELTVNTQTERMEIERRGDSLIGYITRAGEKVEQRRYFEPGGFAADNFLLDQHELFLIMRDISVGDTLEDTIFEPQIMLTSPVRAVVEEFAYRELYKGVFDSVFVIHYSQPQEQYLYFTPDKRLVKADFPGQNMRAYLDVVRKGPTERLRRATLTLGRFLSLLPVYIAYLVIGLISLVFFVGRYYRRRVCWLGFVLGGVLFTAAAFTQIPLQRFLVERLLIDRISAGGSPYFWALLPAMVAAVIQELLKGGLIAGLGIAGNQPSRRFIAIGAVCAAGFGIVEGCYMVVMAGNVELFSWHLLERGFVILFHATSGALLGFALARWIQGGRRWLALLGVTIAFNGLLRYLPVFVQQKAIPVQMMYFVIPIVSLVFLLLTLLLFRKARTVE